MRDIFLIFSTSESITESLSIARVSSFRSACAAASRKVLRDTGTIQHHSYGDGGCSAVAAASPLEAKYQQHSAWFVQWKAQNPATVSIFLCRLTKRPTICIHTHYVYFCVSTYLTRDFLTTFALRLKFITILRLWISTYTLITIVSTHAHTRYSNTYCRS